MKQPSDKYTQELNLEPRQQSDGERAAWLADRLENGTTDLIELTSAIDLLRKYSELEKIAKLVGNIFVHGNFIAETGAERDLEKLMRAQGFFYDTLEQFEKANFK